MDNTNEVKDTPTQVPDQTVKTDVFSNRDGDLIEVYPYTINAAAMTSVYRLKEDFEQRGEYLSLQGVMMHVLDKGIAATRHYWDAAEKNKNKRDFAKQAVAMFNGDGTVRDPEGLAKLAIAKGLVKGTQKEV